MLVLKYILIIIHVLVSVLLMVTILLQSPKGGGLVGSMFGGAGGDVASSLFGARGAANALSKITQYLAGGFLVLSLVISLLSGNSAKVESITQKVMQNTPAGTLPSVDQLGGGTDDGAMEVTPVAPATTPETAPEGK